MMVIEMMTGRRLFPALFAALLILALLAASLPGLALAEAAPACESDHTVQPGEWLAKIALDVYGDADLYPAIVLATNARAAVDDSYAVITDPWRIEPSWKLCLPSAEAAKAGLTVSAIQNATYRSEFTASGEAPLENGRYEEAIVPGSASKIQVSLDQRMALGLAPDGAPMAVVVVYTNSGGSGTFRDLAVLVQRDGALVNVASASLGDRVQIQGLSLSGDRIAVDTVSHGPSDPMCCPTQSEVRIFALEGDALKPVSTAGVGGGLPAQAPEIEGTSWVLESYLDATGQLVSVLPESQVTLSFKQGQATGKASCNSYFGAYTLDGDRLTFGPMGSTLMACEPQARMEQESAYLAALAMAKTVAVSADKLQIANAEGQVVATFAVRQSVALVGTTWQLTGDNHGKGGLSSVLGDTSLTGLLDGEGRVSGSSGCNNYTGSYTVAGPSVSFGPLATTRKLCGQPAGVMDQESAYLAALAKATTFTIEGELLTLTDAEGTRMATFAATD